MKNLAILTAVLLTGINSFATSFMIDQAHSSVGFEVTHLMISTVEGRFDDFQGEVTYDEKKQLITGIKGTAKTASINTANTKRDEHLQSADFFNAKKNPELKFEAKGLKIKKGESEKIKGSLTMNGVKKTVPVEVNFKGTVKDAWGNEKVVVNATTDISRKNFGLTWNKTLDTGGVVVGDEVKIKVFAQAAKAEEKK